MQTIKHGARIAYSTSCFNMQLMNRLAFQNTCLHANSECAQAFKSHRLIQPLFCLFYSYVMQERFFRTYCMSDSWLLRGDFQDLRASPQVQLSGWRESNYITDCLKCKTNRLQCSLQQGRRPSCVFPTLVIHDGL